MEIYSKLIVEPIYSNLTGGSIISFLEIINLYKISGTYTDCQFSTPKECIKNVYPVSEKFTSCNNKYYLEVFQYKSFYHLKIKDNLLKIYDCNKSKEKIVFQILLTDDELQKIEKYLPRLSTTINFVNSSF
jgi:hypothetical protein